jgi:deoxyadenosine/deoxycytidine kinase
MAEPAFSPPRFIAFEGPIRVGKSSLAGILSEQLHVRCILDNADNPFLGEFYQEQTRRRGCSNALKKITYTHAGR